MARQELKLLVYELRNGIPTDALRADARRLAGRDVNLDAATSEDAGLAVIGMKPACRSTKTVPQSQRPAPRKCGGR